MAHFAKLKAGNKVERIDVVANNIATTEFKGVEFLQDFYKTSAIWKQTSYNTNGGVHKLGGTPFRKNYANVGFKYDQTRDAFIAPQDFPSWTLNETSCTWEPPVTYPDDGKRYRWNEEITNWEEQVYLTLPS